MTSNGWVDYYSDDDDREKTLPKWAQERLRGLRRQCDRLMVGVVDTSELSGDSRLAVHLGGDGHGSDLYRELPEGTTIRAKVTGGEMTISLHEFGSRTRLGITGHGTRFPGGAGNEIAVLPALGNVVEVAFVSPAIEVLPHSHLAISQPSQEMVIRS